MSSRQASITPMSKRGNEAPLEAVGAATTWAGVLPSAKCFCSTSNLLEASIAMLFNAFGRSQLRHARVWNCEQMLTVRAVLTWL